MKENLALEETPKEANPERQTHSFAMLADGSAVEYSDCGKARSAGRALSVDNPLPTCRDCWVLYMQRALE